jgi:hypothetical protein
MKRPMTTARCTTEQDAAQLVLEATAAMRRLLDALPPDAEDRQDARLRWLIEGAAFGAELAVAHICGDGPLS